MVSGSKKEPRCNFLYFLSKVTANEPSPDSPMKREAHLQDILHISQKPHLTGSAVKEPSPRSPSWAPSQRDAPTTRALLHSSNKAPGIRASPTHQVPLTAGGPDGERCPHTGDLPNISSRVPSEVAPPKAPLGAFSEREMPHPQSSLHLSLRVPVR
jgi:hypothetical protein